MNNNDVINSYAQLINSALEDYVQFTGDEEDRVTEAMLYSLKNGGKIIVNTQEIDPMPVITGAAKYPENIEGALKEKVNLVSLDASKLALEAGNIKAVNVVLIGVMAKSTDIPYEKWVETLKTTVPEKFLEVNLKAFDMGYNI